jgi:hypothetical protein
MVSDDCEREKTEALSGVGEKIEALSRWREGEAHRWDRELRLSLLRGRIQVGPPHICTSVLCAPQLTGKIE